MNQQTTQSVKFGLAWDSGCDVDGSVVLMDPHGNPLDIISYSKLHSNAPGAVKHSGDDRTGKGGGDDETIKVRFFVRSLDG
jgi:stress response protein SCP2